MRNGKIARIPRNIREELNLRMEDNEDGAAILDWLNALPAVQESLKANFNGVPVSKQNLSEWRQGGFREWQMRQGLIDQARELSDWSGDLGDVVDPPLLSADLMAMLATRYAALLNSWDGKPDARVDEELRVLRGLAHDLALVQRTMYRAHKQKDEFHNSLESERKRIDQESKNKILAPIWATLRQGAVAKLFGGGEAGKKIAEFIIAVQEDLPLPKIDGEKALGQTQSNPVKPENETAPSNAPAAAPDLITKS